LLSRERNWLRQLSIKRLLFFIFLIFNFSFLITFSGCGGNTNSNDSNTSSDISGHVYGYFIDSVVSGLAYVIDKNNSGITDDKGRFFYDKNDSNITFKVGNIIIGTIPIYYIHGKKVFIQDLLLSEFDRRSIENNKVLKIAQFLQSLDTTPDNNDIITLSQEDLKQLTEEKTIDDINISATLASINKSLKNIEDVKKHLCNTLKKYNIASCFNMLGKLSTGQTTSYVDYDDGYYQKGLIRKYIRQNGIVIDLVTGLQWQDDYSDNNGKVKTLDVYDASISDKDPNHYCRKLTLGGYDDWRLPNFEELQSIIDYGRSGPAVNPIFENILDSNSRWRGYYWSSTNFEYPSGHNKRIQFDKGNYDWDDGVAYVICVRGGKDNNSFVISGNRYIRDNDKEVVVDNVTNLMWQDNNETLTNSKTWENAIDYCENLTLGGYDDWYLPNINQLYSITKEFRQQPSINPVFNYSSLSHYWSSTTMVSNTSYAWSVEFEDCVISDRHNKKKTTKLLVRCVCDN